MCALFLYLSLCACTMDEAYMYMYIVCAVCNYSTPTLVKPVLIMQNEVSRELLT